MRILITAGPSSEPIDEVRVITNRSTGELGTLLAECISQAGHTVELFLGQGAAFQWSGARLFASNEELERLVAEIFQPEANQELLGRRVQKRTTDDVLAADDLNQVTFEQRREHA